jgi:hypothetical protein
MEPLAMRRMRWILNVWPGLRPLWHQGSWAGLGVALVAAGLLDTILVVTFGWSELFSPGVRNALWVALGMVWLGGLVFFPGSATAKSRVSGGSDPFPEAIDYYLQGNWFQAERVLGLRLRQDADDLDARLMLATLLRHTGRWDEAERELDLLERCEGAWKWGPEIQWERRLLTEARAAGEAGLEAQRAGELEIPAESTESTVSAAA